MKPTSHLAAGWLGLRYPVTPGDAADRAKPRRERASGIGTGVASGRIGRELEPFRLDDRGGPGYRLASPRDAAFEPATSTHTAQITLQNRHR